RHAPDRVRPSRASGAVPGGALDHRRVGTAGRQGSQRRRPLRVLTVGINTNRWNRLRYTLYAPVYDRVVRFQRPRRTSIDLLALRQGERVLIDGAGTGADLDFIPNGVEVVATDLTPAMVERIRARAA